MIKNSVGNFIMLFCLVAFGQNFDKHIVARGETVAQIAEKYYVTTTVIRQLNPDIQLNLKQNTVLVIPGKINRTKPSQQYTQHKVQPKETLFGIQNQYGISGDDLNKVNPDLQKLGLQVGQVLIIPSRVATKSALQIPQNNLVHEVQAKETKFSIAKQYGITVEQLEKDNPEIVLSLKIGYKLVIKRNLVHRDYSISVKPHVSSVISKTEKKYSKINYIDYVVKSKETLYSLSKMAGLSQDELIQLNPDLVNSVKTGMIILLPDSVASKVKNQTVPQTTTLQSKAALNSRKKLVLLLPFGMDKMELDTVNTTVDRLKNDKFLNITLDFYSGALVAIDSARSIGLPIDVSIFDSAETKTSSTIAAIHQENHLDLFDAIIGPFYQNNIEKTAALLRDSSVPILSPLSKDIGTSFPNLYQTIPTTDILKKTVFNYMIAKGGNIIAVVDKKKESTKQFIQSNYPLSKFVALQENGNVAVENLKSLLTKGKMNYIVLASENTRMVKSTLAVLISSMSQYQIQLVILEPNETLETDEINFKDLARLQLMYPSVTRENESLGALLFEKTYRKKNKIYPTIYATRGFDITFDTMLRLTQDEPYRETADSITTEQVNNKFEFIKKADGGYTNKGVYIMQYNSDFNITEAK